MNSMQMRVLHAFAAIALVATVASATTITLDATPTMVPDEAQPRVAAGNPTGFANDCWQAPAGSPGVKTNFHVMYSGSGDHLSTLFPADAATMTVNDLDEISYNTRNNPAGKDWYIQIYTRATGSGDCRSWYHERWTSNYTTHSAQSNWTNYTTANSSILFSRDAVSTQGAYGCPGNATAPMTLAAMQSMSGTQLVLSVSVHTDSGWAAADPARDSLLDGLVIKESIGAGPSNIGRVNFGSMFLPASGFWSLGALILALGAGLTLFMVKRRQA